MEHAVEQSRIWGVYENTFQVRDAQYSDLKIVYSMIMELAEDLKADISEDVKLTEDQFLSDFREGHFQLIVAEKEILKLGKELNDDEITNPGLKLDVSNTGNKNNSIVGYALYFFGYETWTGRIMRLDDIYIRKIYRKLGLGSYLISILAKISIGSGCKSLNWQCLDWNTKALEFYFNKLKATEEVQEKNGKKFKLVNIELSEEEMMSLASNVS